jgi:hypothetical protein
VQVNLVEIVNQGWSALTGTSAALVSEKLKDRSQRRRIVRIARDSMDHQSAPIGLRKLAGLLDQDWFVNLLSAPGDAGTTAAIALTEADQLARWFDPSADEELLREWLGAIASAGFAINSNHPEQGPDAALNLGIDAVQSQ